MISYKDFGLEGLADNRSAAEKKKDRLGLYTDPVAIERFRDLDTPVSTEGEVFRPVSFDAAESNLRNLSNRKSWTVENQRKSVARLLGVSPGEVSDKQITDAGQYAKGEAERIVLGELEGNLRVSRRGLDVYGRTLGKFYTEDGVPLSDESLFGSQELDMNYNSKENIRKRFVENSVSEKKKNLGLSDGSGYGSDGRPELQTRVDGLFDYGELKGVTREAYDVMGKYEDEKFNAAVGETWESKVPDVLAGAANIAARTATGVGSAIDTLRKGSIGAKYTTGNTLEEKIDTWNTQEAWRHVDLGNPGSVQVEINKEDIANYRNGIQNKSEFKEKALIKLDAEVGVKEFDIKQIEKQSEIDSRRISKVEDYRSSDEFASDARKSAFGVIGAIFKSPKNAANYASQFFESLGHMAAYTNVITAAPMLASATKETTKSNREEFVKLHGREPNESEEKYLVSMSFLGEAIDGMAAFKLLNGGGALGKLFDKIASKAPSSIQKLPGFVKGGATEFAQESSTDIANQLAVKQKFSEIDPIKVGEAGVRGLYGAGAISVAKGPKRKSEVEVVSGLKKQLDKLMAKDQSPSVIRKQDRVKSRLETVLNKTVDEDLKVKINEAIGKIPEPKVDTEKVELKVDQELATAFSEKDIVKVNSIVDSSIETLGDKSKSTSERVQAAVNLIGTTGKFGEETDKELAGEIKLKGADVIKAHGQLKDIADSLEKSEGLVLYSTGKPLEETFSKEASDSIQKNESFSLEEKRAFGDVAEAVEGAKVPQKLEKTVSGVRKAIMGSAEIEGVSFKGLTQYLQDANEGKLVGKEKNNLVKFVSHIKAKSIAVQKAMALSKEKKDTVYLKLGLGGLKILDKKDVPGIGKDGKAEGYMFVHYVQTAGVGQALKTEAILADKIGKLALVRQEAVFAREGQNAQIKSVLKELGDKVKDVRIEPKTKGGAVGEKQKEEVKREEKAVEEEVGKEELPKIGITKTDKPIYANDGKTEIVAKNYGKGRIIISTNKELWKKYFDEKRWTKPRVQADGSKAKPLPVGQFGSMSDLKAFIVEHEKAHNVLNQKENESIGDYESRVSEYAIKELSEKEIISGLKPPSIEDTVEPEEARQEVVEVEKVSKDVGMIFPDKLKGFVERFTKVLAKDKDGKTIKDSLADTLKDKDTLIGKIGQSKFSGNDIVKAGTEILEETPESLKNLGWIFDKFKATFDSKVNPRRDLRKVIPGIDSFYDENGNLPDQVIYSLAVGAAEWLASEKGSSQFNDQKFIGNYLYSKQDARLSSREIAGMQDVGLPLTGEVQSAGRNAVNTLGVKFKRNTEGDFARQEELESSFGLMIFDILGRSGLADVGNVTLDVGKGQDGRLFQNVERKKVKTVKVKKGSNYSKSFSGFEKVFEKLNGAQHVSDDIYLEKAPEHAQKRARGGIVDLPSKVQKSLKMFQETKWKPISGLVDLVQSLDVKTVEKLGGIQDVNKFHKEQRKGVNSKNNGILKDIELIGDMVGLGGFWFKYQAMKNHRIMISSNGINPMRSKIHRFLVTPKSFDTNVDPKNKLQMAVFKAAVVQAFDEGFDKGSLAATEKTFDSIVSRVEVGVIVDAILKKDSSKLNELLIKDGGNFHKLAGYYALAQYVDSGGKKFTSNLGVETDAVTSGYAIGLMQFMGASKDKFLRVGISLDKKFSEYREFLDQNLADTYTVISNAVKKVLDDSNDRDVIDALSRVHGDVGRNLAKPAFMIKNYEASLKKSVEGVTDDLIDKIYSQLAIFQNRLDSVDSKYKATIEREQARDGINGEIDSYLSDLKVIGGHTFKRSGDLKRQVIPVDAIVTGASEQYTPAFQAAFDSLIGGTVKDRKDSVSDAIEGLYFIFQYHLDEKVAEKEKEIGRAVGNVERRELAAELVGTSYPVLAGVELTGTGTVKGTRARQVTNQIKSIGGGPKTSNVNIHSLGYQAPGASAMVRLIQNIDATILAEVMAKYEALTIYDAGYYSQKDVINATAEYNKAFLEVSKNRRLAKEILSQYDKVIEGLSNKEKAEISGKLAKDGHKRTKEKPSTLDNRRKTLLASVEDIEKEFEKIKDLKEAFLDQAYFVIKRDEKIGELSEKIGSLGETVSDVGHDLKQHAFYGDTTEADIDRTNNEIKETDEQHPTVEQKTHSEHLDGVIDSLVKPLLKKIGGLTLDVRTTDKLSNGWFNVADNSIRVNFNINRPRTRSEQSGQEVYAHELVHSVARKALGTNARYREKVRRLFESVKGDIKVEDFGEDKEAQDQYDAVFNDSSLQEFLAYGLTNPVLVQKLKASGPVKFRFFEGDTWYEKIFNALVVGIEKIGDIVDKKKTPVSAYIQLLELTQEVNGINQSKTSMIARRFNNFRTERIEKTDQWLFDLVNNNKDLVAKTALKGAYKATQAARRFKNGSEIGYAEAFVSAMYVPFAVGKTWNQKVKNTKKMLSGFGKLTAMVDNKVIRAFYGAYHQVVHRTEEGLQRASSVSHDKVEVGRKKAKDTFKLMATMGFIDADKLDSAERKSLLNVFGRADLQALKKEFSVEQILYLIKNEKKLSKLVDSRYGKLDAYWKKQVNGLSDRMLGSNEIEGNVFDNVLAMLENAPEGSKKVDLGGVDVLISLMALDKTDTKDRGLVGKIGDAELADPSREVNGFEQLLMLFQSNFENSRDEAFAGEEMLMTKGYVARIFDPHKSVMVASVDSDTVKLMELKGYKLKYELKKYSGETIRHGMYNADNLALDTHSKGTMSTTTKSKSHTSVKDIATRDTEVEIAKIKREIVKEIKSIGDKYSDDKAFALKGTDKLHNRVRKLNAALSDAMTRMRGEKELAFKKITEWNANLPAGQKTNLRPVVNPKGEVVDYTYDMSLEVQEELLSVNSNVFDVIGEMAMRTVDKVESEKVNESEVDRMLERAREHRPGNEHEFVNIVGTKWADETYVRMPYKARQKIEKIANENNGEFWVEEVYLDAIFGYDNWSMAELVGGERIKRKIRQFEEVVHGIVGIINNNIVIKTPAVWGGNFVSNYMTSVLSGMGVLETIKYWREGLVELERYQKDAEALRQFDIRAKVDSKFKKAGEANRKRLVDRLNGNPTKELIDAGLYNAITTEGMFDDEFSYKNKAIKYVEDRTKNVIGAGPITTIVKGAYLAEDTQAYKSLLGMVQVSDFLGRYGVYKKMIEDQDKSKSEAYRYIQDVFVDYQVPVGKAIAYGNSMGMIMFYKYFSRIQRPIFGMIKNHPTKSLGFLGSKFIFGLNIDTIFNSGIITGGRFTPVMGGFHPWEMLEQLVIPSGVEIGISPLGPIKNVGAAAGTIATGAFVATVANEKIKKK